MANSENDFALVNVSYCREVLLVRIALELWDDAAHQPGLVVSAVQVLIRGIRVAASIHAIICVKFPKLALHNFACEFICKEWIVDSL